MAITADDIKFYESTSGLGGAITANLITTNTLNNLWDNVQAAESTSGDTEYRALFIKNTHSSLTLEVAKVWIDTGLPSTTLTDDITSTATKIYVTDNANFPSSGAFFIEDEEIPYTSKSSDGGGDYFDGCTRGANKAAHELGTRVEHHQIRIAVESPTSNTIQSIGNEYTAPSGRSFTAPYSYSDGLSLGDLDPSECYGVWMRRKVPVGCGPKTGCYVTIKVMGETAE